MLLSAEGELPYYRLNLTRYLAGEIADDELPVHPAEWFEENRIDLRLGTSVRKIQPLEKSVDLDNDQKVEYDKLVFATGAHPFMPPIIGNNGDGVFTLRTVGDAKSILAAAKPGTQVACIGGGILGLETAGALARSGARVTVLEAFDHLMPRQLNAAGGEVLLQHLGTLNINVIKQAQAERIDAEGVQLKDGRRVPADVVVVAVGVRSNVWMLKEAGLPVNNGVLVDNFMRTSNPDILAAGDACEHDGAMYGSWGAAQFQGRIAGLNAAGVPTEFGGIPRSHMLKILGKDMASIGQIQATDGSYRMFDERTAEGYRMFMVRDGIIVGALLLGDISLATPARSAIEAGTEVGEAATLSQVVGAITQG
jgi:nitrite reductase (NADH) large subunit